MGTLSVTILAALALPASAFADSIAERYPVAENVRGHENTEWSTSYAYHLTDANARDVRRDLRRAAIRLTLSEARQGRKA